MMRDRHFIALGAITMLLAVFLGAFGAHALKPFLGADMLAIWNTAVHYQMAHALALIAIGLLLPRFNPKHLRRAGCAFFIGILFFSGSLYVLALTGIKILGAITPLGGIAFLVGWTLLAWCAIQHPDND